jgi:uncharacterized protein
MDNMEKISITNKYGEKLAGIKTPAYMPPAKPDGTLEETGRTVVLVHGFGVTKEEGGMFDQLAEKIATAGINVYRFDFSGCGESEGDYSETSLTKLKEDLDVILKYVKSQSDVDSSRIGILAQSFGTSVTIALQPDVKTIMLMGSVANCKNVFKHSFGKDYNPTGISTKTKSSGRIIELKPIFWSSLEKYNLLKLITTIHCPILFLHGENDTHVPISETEAFYKKANKPKKTIILPDADHGLKPKRKEMHQIAVDWFKKYL